MKVLSDMWNDALNSVTSLPFLGDALAWAKVHEFVWLWVMGIVLFKLANEWAKSGTIAHWVNVASNWLLIVAVLSFALPYFNAGYLNFAPSWGGWGLAIVIAVCHAQIADWVNWAFAKLASPPKAKASAPAPAKH